LAVGNVFQENRPAWKGLSVVVLLIVLFAKAIEVAPSSDDRNWHKIMR